MAENIFVGYSPSDAHFGEAMMAALAATGAHVWHEEQSSEKTTALLNECQVFLLVLSPGALQAPALRNLALEYATLHNFHPDNALFVVLLEPLASRDLWLFIRHNPQIARDGATDGALIQRIVQKIATLESSTPVSGDVVLAPTNATLVSRDDTSSGKPSSKNTWRPIVAITALVIAFVVVAAIAARQLWLTPHASQPSTATTSATGIGSTTSGSNALNPTVTPPPRAISTTQAEATATPHATASPRAQPSPIQGATNVPTAPTAVPPSINFTQGFASTSNLQFNNGASLNGTVLQLTDNNDWEARSAFYTTPVNVTAFTCRFTFQAINAGADGLTFTIQNNDPSVLGPPGSDLGYTGIGKSVAVKFDLYSTHTNSNSAGVSTTGIYQNGAFPDQPETFLPAGMDFHSGHMFDVLITYSAGSLTTTITDINAPGNPTFAQTYGVDIPATVGGDSAYVGFTAATGGLAATQDIATWSYTAR